MSGFKIIGLSILFLSSLAFAVEEETKEKDATWNDYKIIAERNIFNRYRTGVVVIPRQQQVVVPSEQSYYTLRGIARQADGYISFIEDTRTANVTRFKKGDAVAEGKISAISMDEVTYEYGDKALKVKIGMNLEGDVLSRDMRYFSSGNGAFQARNSFAEMGQIPGMSQAQGGMGQLPGMDQSQTGNQFQGRGAQGRGMGQFQYSGPTTPPSQFQQNGQQQGIDQRQVMGQTQSKGQSASTIQSQTTGQSSVAGQTGQTTTQAVTGTGQSEGSEDILERLKERRKKELE